MSRQPSIRHPVTVAVHWDVLTRDRHHRTQRFAVARSGDLQLVHIHLTLIFILRFRCSIRRVVVKLDLRWRTCGHAQKLVVVFASIAAIGRHADAAGRNILKAQHHGLRAVFAKHLLAVDVDSSRVALVDINQFSVTRRQREAAVRILRVAVPVQAPLEAEHRAEGHWVGKGTRNFRICTGPRWIGVESEGIGAKAADAGLGRIADESAGVGIGRILEVIERPRAEPGALVGTIGPVASIVGTFILQNGAAAAARVARHRDSVGPDAKHHVGQCPRRRRRKLSGGTRQRVGPENIAVGDGAGCALQRVGRHVVRHSNVARRIRDGEPRAADRQLVESAPVIGFDGFRAGCRAHEITNDFTFVESADVLVVPLAAFAAPIRVGCHGIRGPVAVVHLVDNPHTVHARGWADFRVNPDFGGKCRRAVLWIVLCVAHPQAAGAALRNAEAVVRAIVVVGDGCGVFAQEHHFVLHVGACREGAQRHMEPTAHLT